MWGGGGGCVLVLLSMMGVFVSVDCRTEAMLKHKRREEREAKTIRDFIWL